MTATLAKCRFTRVIPKDKLADDPDRTQVLETARLAARTAHEIASPPLVSALGYLASLSDNSLLPVELRYKAKQAALRVAEAAGHLEYLPEVFNAYRTVTGGFPTTPRRSNFPTKRPRSVARAKGVSHRGPWSRDRTVALDHETSVLTPGN